jgi:hypothetical protein
MQRWDNIVKETALALGLSTLYSLVLYAFYRKWFVVRLFPVVIFCIFLFDVGRVNTKFLLLQDVPEKATGALTPAIGYLAGKSILYRTLPMNGADPMQYASHRIPVMFTPNPVQQQRWQDFLDAFVFDSPMPDMMNVRYIVYDETRYQREKGALGDKFRPVFRSPTGGDLVLENMAVLPKAWLVPSVAIVQDAYEMLSVMRSKDFDAARIALVEKPPSIPLVPPGHGAKIQPGAVKVGRYDGNNISLTATAERNSLLVLGEKYFRGWHASVDGKKTAIVPVNYVLRGVYLTPGTHRVEFVFDPTPFKIGKWLTLASFSFFAVMLGCEAWKRRRQWGKG